jgi:hypothetical protein
VSEPPPPPVAVPDWQQWQVTATGRLTAPEATEAPVRWRAEIAIFGLVTAYSLLLGGAVGLIWPRLAPHVQLVEAINGSEAATKALLGDDMWLALLGVLAGVLSVTVLSVLARDAGSGPGGILGLAVGGVLGSLVAAHVGHLVQHPHVVSALRAAYPHLDRHQVTTILGYFDFRVRANGVLVAWPVSAVILATATSALRQRRVDAKREPDPR